MFTYEKFISGLTKSFSGVQIAQNEESISLTMSVEHATGTVTSENVGEISLEEINAAISRLSTDVTYNEFALYRKTAFEVPVTPQDRMRMNPYRFLERSHYQTDEHNYQFLISKASVDYVVALFCFYATYDRELDIPPMNRIVLRGEQITSLESLSDYFRFITVKISAPVECSLAEFKKLLQSYLFNISYCNNIVYRISNLSEDRYPLRRGVRRNGQLFPYKHYNAELVKYYYQGLSTDLPFTQYLAFYHVAEFFFQTIAEQDAFQEIEDFITRPSFSPHKKEDIRQFYNKIKKKMRDQREDGVWDEKIGLLLCLKKYVPDIENLKNTICSIDGSAVNYYSTTDVSFADEGKKISFNGTPDSVYATIRNRIYSVRNAIVHSKEGERLRYEPFRHDPELAKEIPLVRAIAEEIIVNSAKALEIRFE